MASIISDKNKIFSSLLENSSLVVFYKDTNGNYVFVNHEYEKLFHCTLDDIKGKNDYDIFPSDIADELRCADQEVIKTGSSISKEETVIVDGQKKTYLATKYPVYDEDKNILGVAGIATEISDTIRQKKETEWSNTILDVVNRAQISYIQGNSLKSIMDNLLQGLLQLSESDYGFIGEVFFTNEGNPYLKTHAITDISWNVETSEFYMKNAPNGLEFFNLNTLFGAVLTSEELVIANDPANDPRRGGLPEGHPPLNSFMGIPFHAADTFVGMIGVANRRGGYDKKLVADLEPFINLCASLISEGRNRLAKKKSDTELKESENRMHAVLESIIDGMIIINYKGIIQTANSATEKIFGYSKEEMTGNNIKMLMPSPFHEEHDGYLSEYLNSGIARVIGIGREVRGKRKNGEIFPLELGVAEVKMKGIRMFVGTVRDISERKKNEEALLRLTSQLEEANSRLLQQSVTDELTGLFNRRYFNESLEGEMKRIARSHENLSLVIFDIDYFKKYNDNYGHVAGDKCIQAIADTAKKMFKRKNDFICRYGGEEFVVLLPGVTSRDAENFAEEFRMTVESLGIEHKYSLVTDHVTISIGVASTNDYNEDEEELVKQADAALYKAKENGRNRVEVWSAEQSIKNL